MSQGAVWEGEREGPMKNRIQELRKKKGVSQQKCAEDVGISIRTLQRYEKGHLGSLEYIKKLADYFNVHIDELERKG